MQSWYLGTDLVQGSYGDLAYIIRNVFPGRALRVARGYTLPVPQVTWTGSSHIRYMIRICLPRNRDNRYIRYLVIKINVCINVRCEYKCNRFTIFIYCVDWCPPNRHLLQLLFGWGGDVVPTVSCRGRNKHIALSKWKSFTAPEAAKFCFPIPTNF